MISKMLLFSDFAFEMNLASYTPTNLLPLENL